MDSGLSSTISDQDFLSDIIPYRCPKCGDSRVFSTLRDLKRHLETDHAYKMGCVKPRTRAKVFSYSADDSKPFPKDIAKIRGSSRFNGKDGPIKQKVGMDTKYADNDDGNAFLLDAYRDETKRLERRVELAKETEMMNKMNRNIKDGRQDSHCVHKVGHADVRSRLAADVILTENIRSLNDEICRSRQHQWTTANNLYRSEKIITGIEKAAEQRYHEQQGVIQELANNLKLKEDQLNKATKGLEELQRERQGLMHETKVLLDRSEVSNESLRSELSRRDGLLESANEQLLNLQLQLRESLQERDGELARTHSQVEQLEREREILQEETQRLVSGVEMDNSVLKQTLDVKENQLRKVNINLQKTRQDKENLVRESINLYRTASEGNLKLRSVIEAKQSQLSDVQQQVMEMKEVHELLLRESKQLTEQASIHRQTLMQILSDKEAQLSETRQQLQDLMAQRHRAEQMIPVHEGDNTIHTINNDNTEGRESSNSVIQTHMQNMQEQLQQKERELDVLKQFISNTAEKEAIARQKLESFINGLINRADQAESELRQIKSQSGTSMEEDKGRIGDRGQGHPRLKKRINTDRSNKKPRGVDGQNPPKSIDQGPEFTSTPILAARENEDRFKRVPNTSLAKQVMDDVIDPWNKSIPSSVFTEELSKVLPPREFADCREEESFKDVTDDSVEDEDSIGNTETSGQGSGISDIVSLLNARQSDNSYTVNDNSNRDSTIPLNSASKAIGLTGDTNSRRTGGSDPQSHDSDTDLVPVKLSDIKQSDDHKSIKNFLSKGKKKLKHFLNPRSKAASPKARKSRPDKKSKDDTNKTVPSAERQDRRLRNYDFSPEHDSTSYSPLPDSLQHIYNITTSPVMHSVQEKKSNTLRKSTDNQPIKAPSEKPTTDKETENMTNGITYDDKNKSHIESSQASSAHTKEYRDRENCSTVLPNNIQSSEIQPVSEDSYLHLPSHHDEIIFVPVNSKTGRVMKQIPDIYENRQSHHCTDERSHLDSGTHASLEARDFRLEGKESSQVLPVVVPTKQQGGVRTQNDSSSDSMYDESSVQDLEDDHSLCDVGSILEDEPVSEDISLSSLDKEMDNDGIIWVRDDNDMPSDNLDNQQRFGPYGSEMRSRSSSSMPETDKKVYDFEEGPSPYHSYDSEAMPDTYPKMQSNHVHFKDDPRSDPCEYDRKRFSQKYNFRNKHNVGTWMSPAANTDNQSPETYSEFGSADSISSRIMSKSYPIYRGSVTNDQRNDKLRSKSMLDLNENFQANLSGDGVLYAGPDRTEQDNKQSPRHSREAGNYNSYIDFRNGLHNASDFSPHMDFSVYDERPYAKSRSALNLRVSPEFVSNNNIPRSMSAQGYNRKFVIASNPRENITNNTDIHKMRSMELSFVDKRHIPDKRNSHSSRLDLERKRFADNVKRKLEEINQRAGMQSQSMCNLSHARDKDGLLVKDDRRDVYDAQSVDRTRHGLLPYGGDVWDRSRSMTDLHRHRQMDRHTPTHRSGHSHSMILSERNVNHGSQTNKPQMRDSSSQTFLLDRKLSGKSVEDLEEISSSVSEKDTETHTHWSNTEKLNSYSPSSSSSNDKTSDSTTLKDSFTKDLDMSKPDALFTKNISTVNKEKSYPVPAARSKSPRLLEKFEPPNQSAGHKEKSVEEYKEVDTVSDHSLRLSQSQSESESHSASNSNENESYKMLSSKDDHESPCTPIDGINKPKEEENLGLVADANDVISSTAEDRNVDRDLNRDVNREELQNAEISPNARMDETMCFERNISEVNASEHINADIAPRKEEISSHSKMDNFDEDSNSESIQRESFSNNFLTIHEQCNETVNDIGSDVEFNNTLLKESIPSVPVASKSSQGSESETCILSDTSSDVDSYCHQSYEHLDEDFEDIEESPSSEPIEHLDLQRKTSRGVLQKSTTMHELNEASDVREPLSESEKNTDDMKEDFTEQEKTNKDATNENTVLPKDFNIDPDGSKSEVIPDVSFHQSQSTDYELDDEVLEMEYPATLNKSDFGRNEPHPVLQQCESLDGLFAEVQETDEDSMSLTDDLRARLTPASSLESLIENRPKSKHAERRKRRMVLHSIFRFLDVETLLQVALVCREWKHVSRHPDLWKQIRITGQKCSSQFLTNLSRWSTKTQLLSLIDLKSRDKLASETEEEYVASIRGSLEPGLERFLQVTESTLRSVEIVNCGYLLTDKSIWLASCYCRLLHTVVYITNTIPLGPDVMWAFGAGCRSVTSLVIPPLYPCENSERFNNKCLQTISQCCVDLEVLSIGGPSIDINGLVLVAKSCQSLRRFELHHSNTIDEDTAVALCRVGLQNLTHLNFIHTTVTPSALMHFYEHCRHLLSLVVAMSISDFNNHREDVELEEIEKWCIFVQEMKELEAVPRLGNIIKINLQSV